MSADIVAKTGVAEQAQIQLGDPESAAGARVTRGVVKRLHEAGFAKVTAQPKAFGVVAYK